jgi:hypothetical protein
MLRVFAMGKIQPGDIHSGLNQAADIVDAADGGSKGADNLRSAHRGLLQDLWQ